MSSIAAVRSAHRWPSPVRPRQVAAGFLATLAAALLLAIGAAIVIGFANEGRVLPGVQVGGVHLGGMDRAAALERLQSTLPSLAAGTATLVVGDDRVQIAYAQVGRGYDLGGMADAALGTGRDENPVATVIARLRDVLVGTNIAVQVAYDSGQMDALAAQVARDHSGAPLDAAVTLSRGGTFVVQPARAGATVDATAVRQEVGRALGTAEPGDMTITIPVALREPTVSTPQAQAAADLAGTMTGQPLALTDGTDSFRLKAVALAKVIAFDRYQGGAFAPHVDSAALTAAVAAVAKQVDRKATDATYKFGSRITVVPSKTGRKLDQAATGVLVANALTGRAAGAASPGAIQLPVTVTQPKLTTQAAQASVAKIVRISTWTTYYIPGISNGYGANISIPANTLNGQVVAPGATFDFWRAIGPVTFERGYTYGGAIINGKSEHTGALAGGICSTSTTMFNAALRAGLQMGERWNHYYYISRYPVGLDATVFADAGRAWSMSFTNDTPYPIIIRSFTSYGIVTFSLYSVPTGRTVTLTTPIITNRVAAYDTYVKTTSLAPGVKVRLEPIYNGFDASVTRYVRDRSGAIIHTDQYFSHYHPVNGIVEVGVAPS
jgi:vancomycin resistance protein YoaR